MTPPDYQKLMTDTGAALDAWLIFYHRPPRSEGETDQQVRTRLLHWLGFPTNGSYYC